jgi:hypothetical protein
VEQNINAKEPLKFEKVLKEKMVTQHKSKRKALRRGK